MSVCRIRLLGDPALRQVCEPADEVGAEVRALIDDLLDTMYAADGIGLAAPQIGVPLRIFVYDIREQDIAPGVLVNPRIVERHGQIKEEEGCLSIPDLREIVTRNAQVVIEGLGREGEEVRIEADGLLSRCLQHECDHLDGVLFIDLVSPLKRKMLLSKWSKREPGERPAVPAM